MGDSGKYSILLPSIIAFGSNDSVVLLYLNLTPLQIIRK